MKKPWILTVSIVFAAAWIAASVETAPAQGSVGSPCGAPELVPSDYKCHGAFSCRPSPQVTVGSATVGAPAGSDDGGECCHILEFIPEHNSFGTPALWEMNLGSVEGWTMTGTCQPVMITILWLVTVPSGALVCEYSNLQPRSYENWVPASECGMPGPVSG